MAVKTAASMTLPPLTLVGSARNTATNALGPRDHGRAMKYDEFANAEWAPGYQYELIDGRVYVSPVPDPPQGFLEEWIGRKLWHYAERHPDVFNHVMARARIVVPGRRGVTQPEPDRTAFRNFPLRLPLKIRWEDLHPLVVVEVVSRADPYKDLVRNLELYLQVPTIKEYWVIDGRVDPDQPTLVVHRRQGARWKVLEVPYGATYETRLLPRFKLLVDPRQ